MDINATARVTHALAALQAADGDVAQAAASQGITSERLRAALAEGGGNFYEVHPDGRIVPTPLGERFAERASVFPSVSW